MLRFEQQDFDLNSRDNDCSLQFVLPADLSLTVLRSLWTTPAAAPLELEHGLGDGHRSWEGRAWGEDLGRLGGAGVLDGSWAGSEASGHGRQQRLTAEEEAE